MRGAEFKQPVKHITKRKNRPTKTSRYVLVITGIKTYNKELYLKFGYLCNLISCSKPGQYKNNFLAQLLYWTSVQWIQSEGLPIDAEFPTKLYFYRIVFELR